MTYIRSTTESVSLPIPKAIFDKDRRKNIYAIKSGKQNYPLDHIKAQARSVCCAIPESLLQPDGSGGFILSAKAPSLKQVRESIRGVPLGENEKFKHEPVPINRGTFFVLKKGQPYVLTARHVVCKENSNIVDMETLQKTCIVFDFAMYNGAQATFKFRKEDIYRARKVVLVSFMNQDWALVKLDRNIDRDGLILDFKEPLKEGESVYMLGHPDGLSCKFTGKAIIVDRGEGSYCYKSNLAAFCGNSGSPVFRKSDGQVCGILFAGYPPDYHVVNDYQSTGNTREQAYHATPDDKADGKYELVHKITVLSMVENYLLAREGNAQAQYTLGQMYCSLPNQVGKNKGIKWLHRAALQGVEGAREQLHALNKGFLFKHQNGVLHVVLTHKIFSCKYVKDNSALDIPSLSFEQLAAVDGRFSIVASLKNGDKARAEQLFRENLAFWKQCFSSNLLLHLLIEENQKEAIAFFIEKGFSFNTRTSFDNHLLIYAHERQAQGAFEALLGDPSLDLMARSEYTTLLLRFLFSHSTPSARSMLTSYLIALKRKHPDTYRAYLAWKANDKRDALDEAAWGCYPETFKFLIEEGVDPGPKLESWFFAQGWQDHRAVAYFPPWMLLRGDINIVAPQLKVELLNCCIGFAVNSDEGYSFLISFIKKQIVPFPKTHMRNQFGKGCLLSVISSPLKLEYKIECVNLLLSGSYPDDVNQVEKSYGKGLTPLISAASSDFEILQILLNRSEIDVNRRDPVDGDTALHVAVERGAKRLVQALLQHKDINVNTQNFLKQTPLHLASDHSMWNILIQHGASPYIKDWKGNYPQQSSGPIAALKGFFGI